MNKSIIENLTELKNYYQQEQDKFRTIAYTKAINAIRNIKEPITNVEQLSNTKGIGPKITAKINQLIQDGNIKTLESIHRKEDPIRKNVLNDFLTIYGIGPVAAAKLYDVHKIKSLTALKNASQNDPNLLTAAQKVGLRHREALLRRIPRDFINTFQYTVSYCLHSAFNDTFKLQTAGSFRRGKKDSGDIDIMLQSTFFTLKEAVEVLIAYGVVTDILALDVKKFMGIGTCPGVKDSVPFRLDIFMVDETNWWTALVTHTGPKELNTEMRAKAASLGMKLSDQGLTKGTKKLSVKSEKDLFKKLGMKYIIPTER
jgi:DNA polymerase/3'-5' exonuclease PolX